MTKWVIARIKQERQQPIKIAAAKEGVTIQEWLDKAIVKALKERK